MAMRKVFFQSQLLFLCTSGVDKSIGAFGLFSFRLGWKRPNWRQNIPNKKKMTR